MAGSARSASASAVGPGRSAKPSSKVSSTGLGGSGARPARWSASTLIVTGVRPLSTIASRCAANSLGETVNSAIHAGGSSVTAW